MKIQFEPKYFNDNREWSILNISFKSRNQRPLIMIIREYWSGHTSFKINYAEVLFSTSDLKRKLLSRKKKNA